MDDRRLVQHSSLQVDPDLDRQDRPVAWQRWVAPLRPQAPKYIYYRGVNGPLGGVTTEVFAAQVRTLPIPTRGFVAFLLSWLPPGLSSLVGSTLRVAGTGEGRITKRAPGRVGDDQRRAKCGIGKPIRFVLFLIAAWLAGTQVGDPDLIYCVYHLHGDSPYGVYFDSAFPQL